MSCAKSIISRVLSLDGLAAAYMDVTAVTILTDTRLALTFESGEVREVDIASLVPFDGVFEPLNNPAYFGQVRVDSDAGTIVWPNGADICQDVLYECGRAV